MPALLWPALPPSPGLAPLPGGPAPLPPLHWPLSGPALAPAPRLHPLTRAVSVRLASAARETGLPWALLRAVVEVESQGDVWAVSPAGAEGLMQLEPPTARALGVGEPFDPAQNLRGGARYLAALLRQYGGGDPRCVSDPLACPEALRLALAAYNAGPGTVARYGGVPPYPETERYVHLVTALYRALAGRRG